MSRSYLLFALAFAWLAQPAWAQGPARLDLGNEIVVGGEAERYLRSLQLAGLAPMQPWTIRTSRRRSVDSSNTHPWASRWRADTTVAPLLNLLRPSARLVYNSAFPFETSPGPTWTGRGLTAELQGGLTARRGRLSLQIAPIAFIAQNQAFALATNAQSGNGAFGDPRFPTVIDAPQRFGPKSYARIDPGNSTVAVDLDRAELGFTTAAESWGPAREYPLVLGPNAGGFPHLFVGTSSPIDLWLFRLNTRIIAGRLSQSDYSPVPADSGRRWATAIALAITPRGLDGLEIGFTRFAEKVSRHGLPTLRSVRRLFSSGIGRTGDLNDLEENGLASAFFRWAFDRAGVEVYAEYYQEDYTLGLRRVIQFPDDYAGYTIGMQKVLSHSADMMRTLRLEVVNAEISPSNRGERGDPVNHELSSPLPPYLHSAARQGHTHHGLILGSPEAYGGAALRIGVDQFDTRGRTSIAVERRLRFDWLPVARDASLVHPDLLWSVRAEAMRFVNGRDYTFMIMPVLDMNRNLQPGRNVFSVSAALTVRGVR